VQETWDGFQRGVISAPAAKQAIAAGIAFLERAHRLGIKEAQGLHAQAFSILKMIEPAFQPREDPPPVEVRRPVSPPGASPGIARPPVAPPSPVPRPPVRRNPPVSSPRHVVSPPAFTRTAPPSWSHRACSLLAGAWLALGASTALALVSGYDVEFLGADLFSPLDPIWRGGGSRFGLMVFVLIPVLLWLAGRWLTAREAGRRLVDRATRPVRFIGVAWMLVVGTLLVDETAAVFSDHLLPRNAFRALGEPLGALGLIGVFALAALFALPLLLRWSVTARRPG